MSVSRAHGFLAVTWQAFVRASSHQSEEGVEIVMGWCCPWLCIPFAGRGGLGRPGVSDGQRAQGDVRHPAIAGTEDGRRAAPPPRERPRTRGRRNER